MIEEKYYMLKNNLNIIIHIKNEKGTFRLKQTSSN